MGLNVSRFVEIQISNKTRNFTLRNPRTYFFSGHILKPPPLNVAPGCSESCKFTNTSLFWGANGVLAFEAESFTLAIYFSNPIDYNRFSVEMGLELSMDKVHNGNLQTAYNRLVKISHESPEKNAMFPFIILKEFEEQAQLSAGPIKVMATMSRGRSAVVRVTLWEKGQPEQEARTETPSPGKHVQEK